jgi:hypothetical protein
MLLHSENNVIQAESQLVNQHFQNMNLIIEGPIHLETHVSPAHTYSTNTFGF